MQGDFILVIQKAGMGSAPDPLPIQLLGKYLALIHQNHLLPQAICFYTEGVKLVCEGSPVMKELLSLEQRGVHLIVCSTCLDFYGLREKVKVGIIGGMPDIIEAQTKASRVIVL